MRKVVPLPTSLSTSIRPLCFSIMPHATASPRPVPLAPLVEKNGSKIFCRLAAEMPHPVSLTRISILFGGDLGIAGGRFEIGDELNGTAVLADGVVGIEQQVYQDLLDLIGVGVNPGQIGAQIRLQFHVAGIHLGLHDLNRPFCDLVDVARMLFRGRLAGEIQQPFHDPAAALGFAHDHFQVVFEFGLVFAHA